MHHGRDAPAAEPAHFGERRAHAVVLRRVAIDDVLGGRRRMRRPFAIEAELAKTLTGAGDQRAADQPAAPGDR